MTDTKAQKLKRLCQSHIRDPECTIRAIAELIGVVVSSFPAVEHGPLYFRSLELHALTSVKHFIHIKGTTQPILSLAMTVLQTFNGGLRISIQPAALSPMAIQELVSNQMLSFKKGEVSGRMSPQVADGIRMNVVSISIT